MPAQSAPTSPYDDTAIEERYLERAPLVRVLAQIRHPALLVLAGDASNEAAIRVASSLAGLFPIYETAEERAIFVTPDGVREADGSGTPIWRLRSADESWQVSFSSRFLAVETSRYEGRNQFCDRLRAVLDVYQREVDPPSVTRVGLRYTNRLSQASELSRLPELVRPELLGPTATSLPPGVLLQHSMSGSQFSTTAGGSLLSWGLLSAHGIYDPTIPPVESSSWLLDIDVFSSEKAIFDAEHIVGSARGLATRAYTHFRWAVTEKFLETFAGP